MFVLQKADVCVTESRHKFKIPLMEGERYTIVSRGENSGEVLNFKHSLYNSEGALSLIATTAQVLVKSADMSGDVGYAEYPKHFEGARLELLKKLGFTDRELKDMNIGFYVRESYYKSGIPIRTGEDFFIVSKIGNVPRKKSRDVLINFEHDLYNSGNQISATATIKQVFVDLKTGKAFLQIPDFFMTALGEYLNKNVIESY